ncbi:integral membrane protein [Colletotrichum plurivorum]|uniref:Integral membrane protein n=1 Tax=Colletotrichum plurivorum TaxID=2175906 RepID=A0A8H6N518_9PEZI|nr:integral membrane protein [Colletotrichum plurivorum]
MRLVIPQAGAGPPALQLRAAPLATAPSPASTEDVLHTINLISQILAMCFVSLFMAVRMFAKTFVAPPFHTEDWLALVAWILSLGYSVTGLMMGYFGGGYHVGTLSAGRYKAFKKLALLWIIIRVFRLHRKTIIGTYAIIVFLTTYSIPILFLKGFVCRPIEGYWDPTVATSCYNQRAIFVADTAVSAVTDLAVLFIPIPVAVTLRMSWKKRIKVMAMLSSGGVATAASLIRLVLVIKLQNSHDETVDLIRFNLLGTAEVSIGLICACLPAVNILLLRAFERSPDSSRNTGGSSRIIELKFLRGSRLRTQRLTAPDAAPAPAAEPEVVPEAPAKSAVDACGNVRGPGRVPVHDVTEVPAELEGETIALETAAHPSDQP